MTDKHSRHGEPIGIDAAPAYTPTQYLRMHAKFCAAMLNARSKGLERFRVGVVTGPEEQTNESVSVA